MNSGGLTGFRSEAGSGAGNEAAPRFVSRKQRLQRQREREREHEHENEHQRKHEREQEHTAEPSPPAKRSKTDGGIAVGSAPLNAEAEPPVVIPAWRLEKERQTREQATTADPSAGSEDTRKWFEKPRSEMTARDWRIMRTDLQIACASLPGLEPLLSWHEVPHRSIAQALASGPFKQPTPIQRAAVPLALGGYDVIGIAHTGSGKTLAFTVPLLVRGGAQSLVLAPTRELALQTAAEIGRFASMQNARVVSLVGGRDFAQQSRELEAAASVFSSSPSSASASASASVASASATVIVATPGRLLDFTDQQLLSLANCSFLVLDEADRMIDLGFEEQLARIVALLPAARQTLMFTATWPRQIQSLASAYTRPGHTHKIEVGSTRRGASVRQTAELVESQGHKLARLLAYVRPAAAPVIVFAATKAACDDLAPRLPNAMPLHGSLSQERREAVLGALRSGSLKCIVATDVASRGIDIPDVSLVVNYDMPSDIGTYIHRIGRTGRAGRQGRAVSLCLNEDAALFKELRLVIRGSDSPVPAFLL